MNSRFFHFLAKAISYLGHPMLMPVYGLTVLFLFLPSLQYLSFQGLKVIFLIVACGTVLFPLLFVPFYILQGSIKSVEMNDRKERIFPLLITFIFYFSTWYFLYRIPNMPLIITGFIMASTVSVFFALLITTFWKISLHAMGAGGLIGLIMYLLLFLSFGDYKVMVLVLLIAGLIGSARLYLKKHEPAELYAGYMLGFLSVFITIPAIYF